MSDRTRRVAIDGNGAFSSINEWQQSSQNDPLTFDADVTRYQFNLNFSIKLGGNDQTVSTVTVWSNGMISLGAATAEQVQFVNSGQNIFSNNGSFAQGFPGEFFFLNTNANTAATAFTTFQYAVGLSTYVVFQTKKPVAFFQFGDAQLVLDEAGFTMFNGAGGNAMGYKIADKLQLVRDSVIDFDTYPDFLKFSGGAGDDTINGTGFNEFIIGNGGNDTLNGGRGDDILNGDIGGDVLNGDLGFDTADYRNSAAPVTVNLATGAASGGNAQGDTLISIEAVFGSGFGDNLTANAAGSHLYGFAGADNLIGGAGNDFLYGGTGADQLNGNGGIDTADYSASTAAVAVNLSSGLGSSGDAAGDTLTNIENITGSAFDDILAGNNSPNTLTGGAGNDTLFGSDGVDILFGGDGDDLLDGGAGADTLNGGTTFGSNDTASYQGSNAAVSVNLATLTASGGHAAGDTFVSIEFLEGSNFNDTLTGDANNNTIEGRAGADTLNGGAGSGDIVKYAASNAAVTVNLLTNVVSGGHAAGDTISNFEGIIGSGFADTLTGNSVSNVIRGGGGADTINGGSGFDELYGDAGNDIINGGTDTDIIYGGADDDILDGGAGVFFDFLFGEGGNDTLLGGDGDDVLTGGSGGDVLNGGAGNDTASYATSTGGVTIELNTQQARDNDAQGDNLISIENLTGSGFADTLIGDANVNIIFGANGDDLIVGLAGNDSLSGGEGNDNIIGDSGDDTIGGGNGNDTLNGGLDNDTLSGDAGDDLLEGGAGADSLSGGDGFDLIVYRNSTAGVSINFSTLAASGGEAEGDTLQAEFFQDPFTGNASQQLLIEGVIGSAFADSLTGDSKNNQFEGLAGADTINGGDGVDTLSYQSSSGGVAVNLAAGTASGGDAQGDVFSNFENITGSNQADVLTGDGAANTLLGLGGDDILTGGGGSDTLDGGTGFDEARYAGSRKSYVISKVQEGSGFATRIAQGPEAGTDTLRNVEQIRFTDGVLTFDPNSNAAKVMRLYNATLQRAPDPQGYEFWLGQLDNGFGLNAMANAFAASNEFVARYGSLNNQQFVEQLYLATLGRAGDGGGIAFWTGFLNNGGTRGDMLREFSEGSEHVSRTASQLADGLWVADAQARVAARMFDAALDRLPDTSGLEFWTNQLKNGFSVIGMANEFANGPEFTARFGSLGNQQFVEQLYLFALNRPADGSGLQFWTNFLNNGGSRGQMLAEFSEGSEHVNGTAALWYNGVSLLNPTSVIGSDASETLPGDAQANTLTGLAGNDVLIGGVGSDVLDGGTGFDEARYADGRSVRKFYTVTSQQEGSAFNTLIAGGPEGGTDTLRSIEQARFVDGVLTFDPQSNAAKIMRLYDAALQSPPDPAGFEFWLNRLESGFSLNSIAAEFANAAPFLARVGPANNRQFVEHVYFLVLGHNGDYDGIDFWTGQLDAGYTRGDLLLTFSETGEHIARTAGLLAQGLWIADPQARIAARMYDAALDRLPDSSGLGFWTNQLKNGFSVVAMANEFANGPEFTTKFGSLNNQQFVQQLYLATLNRPADGDGLTFWTNFLNNGGSRGQMLAEFSESAEHVSLTAPLWYNGVSVADTVSPSTSNAAISTSEEREWEAALATLSAIDETTAANPMLSDARAPASLFDEAPLGAPNTSASDIFMPDLLVHTGRNLDHLLHEFMV